MRVTSAAQPASMPGMDHALPAALPPFEVFLPVRRTAPIVFASPHSGRNYRPDFLQAARLDPQGLRRSEDSFVDELFGAVPDAGAPLLCATFPRAYCDPNREPWELDPGMFADDLPNWVNTTSARVGAGLGTLARVVASGESIYREKLPFSEAEFRVGSYWKPYHAMLSALISETRAQFGVCLLVDCHSMPAHSGRGAAPDFVLGDVHGTSCPTKVTTLVEATLQAMGYDVRRNDPYAGGYVTRHYGRPRDGVSTLQIEIARNLYMDEVRLCRSAGFGTVQRQMTGLAERLCEAAPQLLG